MIDLCSSSLQEMFCHTANMLTLPFAIVPLKTQHKYLHSIYLGFDMTDNLEMTWSIEEGMYLICKCWTISWKRCHEFWNLWWLIFIVILTGFRFAQETHLWVCLSGRFQQGLSKQRPHTLNVDDSVLQARVPEWKGDWGEKSHLKISLHLFLPNDWGDSVSRLCSPSLPWDKTRFLFP